MKDVAAGARPSPSPYISATACGIRTSQRDVLPLPHLLKSMGSSVSATRTSCQRRSRAAAVTADANRCIDALNGMYAEGAAPDLMAGSTVLTDAQARSQDMIRAACAQAGRPPGDLTPAEALAALRLAGPYSDEAPLGPAAFDAAAVSLPEAGSAPVPLDILWGDGGQSFVERLCCSCLAPSTCALYRL